MGRNGRGLSLAKNQAVPRWNSPQYVMNFLAKACHAELEGLLESLHRRRDCHSLTLGERKSNVVSQEIAPASKSLPTILVVSSSNSLSSKGFRFGGAIA